LTLSSFNASSTPLLGTCEALPCFMIHQSLPRMHTRNSKLAGIFTEAPDSQEQ
jgi:hypothetical protein